MKKVSITNNIQFTSEKPCVSVLLETEATKEIRILLAKNQVMKEHKTKYPITVEIFDGEIDFGVNRTSHVLKKGDLVSLEANVPHDLLAKKDSVVRLTLAKLDTVKRVINVTKK